MSTMTPPVPAHVLPNPTGRRTGWTLATAALLILGAAAGWLWWSRGNHDNTPDPATTVRTAVAASGPLESVIRLNGQTSARSFYTITAPIMRGPEASGNMILQKLAKGGSMVKAGDPLLEIDGQSMADHVEDVKDQLRQGENDIAKRKAEQLVETGQLEQTLKIAKSQWDKAKLEYQPAPIRTEIERELLKLAVDESEARYKQQLKDLEQKKAENAAEIRILEMTVARHKIHLGRHEIDLSRFTVRATKPGMVVTQTIFRGGDMIQIDAGDQVYPGMPVLKVVDPKSMQIEATISQAQSSILRIGQKVRIGFDAFPGLVIDGHVYSIGALAVGGWRQQYYIRDVPVRIAIDKLDPRIIPDLSAFADVVLAREEQVVHVPLSAVDESGKVWVKNANGQFEARTVELGIRSNTDVAVTSGLKAGDQVRLQ